MRVSDVESAGIGSVVVTRIQSTPAAVDRDVGRGGSTGRDLLRVTLHRSGP
jgi:hypothetical protein